MSEEYDGVQRIITPGQDAAQGVGAPVSLDQVIGHLLSAAQEHHEIIGDIRKTIHRMDMTLYILTTVLQERELLTQDEVAQYAKQFQELMREELAKRGVLDDSEEGDASEEEGSDKKEGSQEEDSADEQSEADKQEEPIVGNPWSGSGESN